MVVNPSNPSISLIDRHLLERLSLKAIARITGVSFPWLQKYVNDKFSQIPYQVCVLTKPQCQLTIECVASKKNTYYIWLSVDTLTKKIVGCYIGDRTRVSAQKLWESIPAVYLVYTDFWRAYKQVIPSKRHKAVGKETGRTNHLERLNNTLRQRISRLVRKSLSFSKKVDNHIGALWYFVHHYNAERARVLATVTT